MTSVASESDQDDLGEGKAKHVHRSPSGELVMGLQLLRASGMASIRLQLALARRDRRVAMAALDNLTAIDAELEELVERISTASGSLPELAAIGAWLVDEKAAVTAEKLNLACDVRGPDLVSPSDRLSEVADENEHTGIDPSTGEPEPEPDGTDLDAAEAAPVRRWWPLVLLAFLVAVVAVGVVAYVHRSGDILWITEFRRSVGFP